MIQKLSEAIFKMSVGDRFELCKDEYIEKVSERTFIWNGGEELSFTQFWTYKNNNGEIIRAEPEVLTPEEWVDKYREDYPENRNSEGRKMHQAFKYGTKNGQIKEWKRLKPLIDAGADSLKWHPDIGTNSFKTLNNAFKNLTPPWEPEK